MLRKRQPQEERKPKQKYAYDIQIAKRKEKQMKSQGTKTIKNLLKVKAKTMSKQNKTSTFEHRSRKKHEGMNHAAYAYIQKLAKTNKQRKN